MPIFHVESVGLNTSIHLSMISFIQWFIPLFNNGFFQRIEVGHSLVSIYILLYETLDPKIY